MLPRVTAKNVGDVFLRHTVFPPRRLFLVGLSVTVGSLTKLQIKCHKISSLVDLVDCSDHLPVPVCQFSRIITRWRHSPLLHLRDSLFSHHLPCALRGWYGQPWRRSALSACFLVEKYRLQLTYVTNFCIGFRCYSHVQDRRLCVKLCSWRCSCCTVFPITINRKCRIQDANELN